MDKTVNVTVREYARLTTDNVSVNIDQATISQSAFDWLCENNARLSSGGASLVQVDGRKWLRLDNYVGVVETPCGTRIEILPKHVEEATDVASLRRLMVRMLRVALSLKTRDAGQTSLQIFNMPLPEWLMARFLQEVERLVKRGPRFEYKRVDEESRFLRGQLNAALQIRQPPGRQHFFRIRHDTYSPDRPENRLIQTALERVRKATHSPENWRLANELSVFLEPIPHSREIEQDFAAWRTDRLMQQYETIRPLCDLVLRTIVPFTQVGQWSGFSMLFPMEKLFERFVTAKLSHQLTPGATLSAQSNRAFLCLHKEQQWFRLIPDLIVGGSQGASVLDAKWKRLDRTKGNPKEKYGLNQQDFYQLFVYGHNILGGSGELFLIYPKSGSFERPLAAFEFTNELRLWVVPFDLEMEHLVEGEWCRFATWYSRNEAENSAA